MTTPYCPACGKKQEDQEKAPPISLLIYLKGQRSKAQSWADRCQRHNAVLNAEERERRLKKQQASVARWNSWIAWVEQAMKDEPQVIVTKT